MKIVVINSTGPMGSSVIAAMVEKFGYLNIPVRQLGLHDYLVGKRESHDPYFKSQFFNAVETVAKPVIVGGVNMLDRDSSGARQLLDKALIVDELAEIQNKTYDRIGELYDQCKALYGRAVLYKKQKHLPKHHIELTTDFHKYPLDDISRGYEKEFDDVYYINMHRDFVGWIESIASQRFTNSKKRFIFILRWEFKRYMDYENAIKSFGGLHLDFNDLFDQDVKHLAADISREIKKTVPTGILWENESYDLFGNIKSFDKAFTRADVDGKYLSLPTRKLIKYFVSKKKITRFHDVIVYIFYLFDLARFLLKRKVSLKSY